VTVGCLRYTVPGDPGNALFVMKWCIDTNEESENRTLDMTIFSHRTVHVTYRTRKKARRRADLKYNFPI